MEVGGAALLIRGFSMWARARFVGSRQSPFLTMSECKSSVLRLLNETNPVVFPNVELGSKDCLEMFLPLSTTEEESLDCAERSCHFGASGPPSSVTLLLGLYFNSELFCSFV